MHRPGRVGRDVFDVHLLAAAGVRVAVGRARLQDRLELRCPELIGEAEVDEARACHFDGGDVRISFQPRGYPQRQLTRLHAERLRKQHRGVRRDVAMRGIARRFGGDASQRFAGRGKPVSADDALHRGPDPLLEMCEEVHQNPAAGGG